MNGGKTTLQLAVYRIAICCIFQKHQPGIYAVHSTPVSECAVPQRKLRSTEATP